MSESLLAHVNTLAFDIFGTVLDLTGSMTPPARKFLERKGAAVKAEAFWDQWRARQRIEQHRVGPAQCFRPYVLPSLGPRKYHRIKPSSGSSTTTMIQSSFFSLETAL